MGRDLWIPELVAGGYIKHLPEDAATNVGSDVCASWGTAAHNVSSYMYLSDGVDYKVMAQCTPDTGLEANNGSGAWPNAKYCPGFTYNGLQPLTMVDPARFFYAYAAYSPGAACW